MILDPPISCSSAGLVEGFEGREVEELTPDAAIKRFDKRVVGRRNRPREIELHLIRIRSLVNRRRDEFCTVITTNCFGQAAFPARVLQHSHNVFRTKRLRYFHGQAFARGDVDDAQEPVRAFVGKSAVHKIHTPDFVRRR